MDSVRGTMLLITTLAVFALQPAWAGAPYPFDNSGYLGDAELMPDWSDTMGRQREQSRKLTTCLQHADDCEPLYRGTRHLLEKAAALTPDRQIKLVNYYVNKKRYRNDRTSRIETPLANEPQKYRSRWATVEEFLRRGGDCEDYATTKYFLLRQLGFSVDQLRIVVIYDRQARDHHAVLAVQRDDGKVVLLESDNQIRSGRRHAYRFIYSVNEKSIWDHEAKVSRTTHNPKEKEA